MLPVHSQRLGTTAKQSRSRRLGSTTYEFDGHCFISHAFQILTDVVWHDSSVVRM